MALLLAALGAQPSVASPHLSNGVAQLSQAPRIWLVNDFLDKAEVSYLRGLADATQFGSCENQRVLNNGKACAQLKISSSTPVLDRLAKLWHVDTSHVESLAAVRYSPGSSPSAAHVDHYSDGTPADMTIVLYLTDAAPEEAGHTNFPYAGAAPLSVAPKAGSLLAWMNVDEATGEENPMAKHSVGATPADAPHDRVILQFSITLRPQLKRSCPPL
ncbi:hypothetical protein EMIHUDRAFT_447085, partial [Emiliania huxleyi CCMP1516]|uniref:Prolyl 4-hydroxylase alpha subunit domain-containing protein n=2 Tax=Emiliania huxleyi TaxID=2903 RepID=A0A0D3KD88_EMIH1